MKTFYTERDIEDMRASGVTQIQVNDNVVLTELARDRAMELDIALVYGDAPASSITPQPVKAKLDQPQMIDKVKARVIARLGTDEYDGLLDQIIPKVLAQLNGQPTSSAKSSSPSSASDSY